MAFENISIQLDHMTALETGWSARLFAELI